MKTHLLTSQVAAVLAMTTVPLLVAGSVSAAPHIKKVPKNKISRTQPAAQGTRLIATGAVNPDNSSIKAISADNRFTWVHLTPTTLIVQGGRRVSPGSIGEGDKLICQGSWVDDAWGPIYQAKRVEVIGGVGETALQEKVAAACQRIASSGPSASGGSGSSGADQGQDENSSPVDRQKQPLQKYVSELQENMSAIAQAEQALSDAREQCEGSENASSRFQRAYAGDHTDLKKNFDDALSSFNAAVDKLSNMKSVPTSMNGIESSVLQSCRSYRQYSDDVKEDYSRLSHGGEEPTISLGILKEWNDGTNGLNEAISEARKAAGG